MRLIFSLFFLSAILNISAQESVFPLEYNSQCHLESTDQHKVEALLTLPFADDFAYNGPIPDPSLWVDNHAFINSTYPIDPISIGVATLDGLASNGLPHTPGLNSTASLPADTLTSQNIDLSGLTPLDEVFISFYYQAQGNGFELGSSDSLLLQFKNDSAEWTTVWFSEGIPLDDFQFAILRLDDESYFHDAFQFRFRNYALTTGNRDQWHIDHIRMDDNRSATDDLLVDIAILYEPSSILTNYTQMPWNQFYNYQSAELNSNHYLEIRNNDIIALNTTYEYTISEMITGDILAQQSQFAIQVPAGVIWDQELIEPIVISTDYTSDTVEFVLDYFIEASGDQYLGNNNVIKVQQFGNQLAYDDGTTEQAYGILGVINDGAKLAMEYTLNEPDSISAIAIFFTTVDEDQSDRFFSLIVWDDIDLDGFGQNPVELARMDFQTTAYQPEYNGFTYYILPEPIAVDGTFYIGMAQEDTEPFHLGYDKNNDADDHTYFKLSGEWVQSNLNGAVMMRPVLGGALPSSVNVEEIMADQFTVYPVPSSDFLQIDYPRQAYSDIHIEILNLNGSTMLSEVYTEGAIDISSLTEGMYMLLIKDSSANIITRKKILKN